MLILIAKDSDKMEMIQKTALTVTIIGALNWGLIGFFDFNLVEALFTEASAITRIVYALVGLCGMINLALLFTHLYTDEK